MARARGSYAPSSEDWDYAVLVVKLIEDLAQAAFRETVGELARVLEREGLAAHCSADRLENRSEFTDPVLPSEHGARTILAKLTDCYWEPTEPEPTASAEPTQRRRRHVATAYLARLAEDGLESPDQLRQQAAILLDAAETINRLLRWYAARRASVKTRDLTNDTIAAIMHEWKMKPRATAEALTEHGHTVTEGALKSALDRAPGLGRPRGGEQPFTFYVPVLRRR